MRPKNWSVCVPRCVSSLPPLAPKRSTGGGKGRLEGGLPAQAKASTVPAAAPAPPPAGLQRQRQVESALAQAGFFDAPDEAGDAPPSGLMPAWVP